MEERRREGVKIHTQILEGTRKGLDDTERGASRKGTEGDCVKRCVSTEGTTASVSGWGETERERERRGERREREERERERRREGENTRR
jgi:hypothetical protein